MLVQYLVKQKWRLYFQLFEFNQILHPPPISTLGLGGR